MPKSTCNVSSPDETESIQKGKIDLANLGNTPLAEGHLSQGDKFLLLQVIYSFYAILNQSHITKPIKIFISSADVLSWSHAHKV